MNIAFLGYGEVAKSLINKINKDDHNLFLYTRNADNVSNEDFKKISSDIYAIPKAKSIDLVVDLLAHNDEAIYISKKIIKDSLSAGKAAITANKKLMRKYGNELCDHAQNTNGQLYINSLVASSVHFKQYPVYLSIYNFKDMNVGSDIFRYRGAGPEETAGHINQEIIKVGKIKNGK